MLMNYWKIALKVLGRRKFFTFISLFGISFTLMVLMVVSAFLDNALAPGAPETRLDRTLHVARMKMSGDHYSWQGDPGLPFWIAMCATSPGSSGSPSAPPLARSRAS